MSENEINIRWDLTRSLNIAESIAMELKKTLENSNYDTSIDHVYTSFVVSDLMSARTSLSDITDPKVLEVK